MRGFILRLFLLTALAGGLSAYGQQVCIMKGKSILYRNDVYKIDSTVITSNKKTLQLYDKQNTLLYSVALSNFDSIVFRPIASYPALNIAQTHSVNATYNETTEIYTLVTNGADPYLYTYLIETPIPDDSCVFTFEYQSAKGLKDMQLFFGDPITEQRSIHLGIIPATKGNEWKTFSYNTKTLRESFQWGGKGNRLRVDLGDDVGVTIKLRSLRFRGMTETEKQEQDKMEASASHLKFNTTSGHNHINVTYNNADGIYTITTTGQDPFIRTQAFLASIPADSCVLTFEYQTAKEISPLQAFFGHPISEERSKVLNAIPPCVGAEWRTYSCTIKTQREEFQWGNVNDVLRLDFGNTEDVTIKLRNLRLRGMTAAEAAAQLQAEEKEAARQRIDANLTTYFNKTYPCQVEQVTIEEQQVVIQGTCTGSGKYALVEVPPYIDITEQEYFNFRTDISSASFSITLPRNVQRNGIQYDRLLSKWAVVEVLDDAHDALASHARHADQVHATYVAEPPTLLGKKGIAAGSGALYISDFDNLQPHSITSNIVLNSFVRTTSTSGCTPHTYGGKVYYMLNSYINWLDNIYMEAQKRKIVVSAILLVSPKSFLSDPECDGGYYAMPDMTTPEAVNCYAAALDFLARRYSTGTYGRIHHWIMHNEVDVNEEWTNMGHQPPMLFLDRYVRSMRICANIVRQYDPHAWVLGSYTHRWNIANNGYAPKTMLENTQLMSQAEGDFLWGVAYHHYPIDLTAPEFWKNDVTANCYTRRAQYVTFLNPEVIDDWILQPAHFYQGTQKRLLFFSEQGTNARSYSDDHLQLQAAGAAWMWKKVKQLKGIDGIQWHGWIDNKQEFGLRIGLRSFDEGRFKSGDAKPVWYVWQAADTNDEDKVFASYLPIIGISSWDNILHTVSD